MTSRPRIYLASSWRNAEYEAVLALLRDAGYDVYDFKNEETAFAWSDVGLDPNDFTPAEFVAALRQPLAVAGFQSDFAAVRACDACVFLEPCGKSASLELGYAAGAGKFTVACVWGIRTPELMLSAANVLATSRDELLAALARFAKESRT